MSSYLGGGELIGEKGRKEPPQTALVSLMICVPGAGSLATVKVRPDPALHGADYFFPALFFLSENGCKMLLHFEQKNFFL